MSDLTKDILRVLRIDIDAALEAVTQKHAISLKTGDCTYDSRNGNFTFKLEGIVKGGIGKDGARYEALRSLYPRLPALRSAFIYNGKTHEIVGANSTGSKVFTKSGGKGFQVPVEVVERVCRKN